MQLDGAVALVTGGASGLGEGAARFLASRGARVAVLDIAPGAKAVAGELGADATAWTCDVTVPEQVESTVKAIGAHYGRLDICVNCAGAGPGSRMIDRDGNPHSLELYRWVIDLNLVGTFDVLRWAALIMAANEPGADDERGLIINTASIAGIEGQIGQAAYSAAKAGLIGMTLPLARDLAGHGIRVMTIAPGIMDTPALAAVGERLKDAVGSVHVFPKRLGTGEDFGRLVASIAENSLLNGEVVRLDAATRLAPR